MTARPAEAVEAAEADGSPPALTAVERVEAAFARLAEVDRPEVWTVVAGVEDLMAEARSVDDRVRAGQPLPLAGTVLAVKDNIDLAGVPTTAACPAFAYVPDATAPAVRRLVEAGAVVLGKTNLDQFATGLVGTRSPAFGPVANAFLPDRIAGGSSSGSAVAVALGIVDVALGTDTAGSGRVPAACNGVVGLKPTVGLVSTRGVVPASPSFDCVSVFAATVARADQTMARLVARDATDPRARADDAPLRHPATDRPLRVGLPDPAALGLGPAETDAFARTVGRVQALGWSVEPITTDLLEEAGRLLYGSALLAERHAAIGHFLAAHPDQVDPVVAEVVGRGAGRSASDYLAAWDRLLGLRVAYARATAGLDVVVVPTIASLPTLVEVAADPIGVNAGLGRFASGANLLDLCGAAIPAGTTADGLPFGVTVLGPARSDPVVAAAAAVLADRTSSARPAPDAVTDSAVPATVAASGAGPSPATVPLAVVGLHLSGQPLNHQLTDRGARLVSTTTTAAAYRLLRLATDPVKPGLVRDATGAAIEVEVWALPAAEFAAFVVAVAPPLAVGTVELADGSTVPGFVARPEGLPGATDITAAGSWRAALAADA